MAEKKDLRTRIVGGFSVFSQGRLFNPLTLKWLPKQWPTDQVVIEGFEAAVALAGVVDAGFTAADGDVLITSINVFASAATAVELRVDGVAVRRLHFAAAGETNIQGDLYGNPIVVIPDGSLFEVVNAAAAEGGVAAIDIGYSASAVRIS